MEFFEYAPTAPLVDPWPCVQAIRRVVHNPAYFDDSSGLGLINAYTTYYAETVPDISLPELTTFLDIYILPGLEKAVSQEIRQPENHRKVVYTLGCVSIAKAQNPHPTLYEPVIDFMHSYEASGRTQDTTAQEVARILRRPDDLIGLYTAAGDFESDLNFAFNTQAPHLSYMSNMNRIAEALIQTSAIEPAQKAEDIITLLQEMSDSQTRPDCYSAQRHATLFGTLYEVDPIRAVQLAATPADYYALVLGMLRNGHTPPAQLLKRSRPAFQNSRFLSQDIILAYNQHGDFETAHKLLIEQLDDGDEDAKVTSLDTLASLTVDAISRADDLSPGSLAYDLCAKVAALGKRVKYSDSMRPYALVKKALVERGRPDMYAIFILLCNSTDHVESPAIENLVEAYIYADDLKSAVFTAETATSLNKKARYFYHAATALYSHSAGDPASLRSILELCETSFSYYQQDGIGAPLSAYESVLRLAISAEDYPSVYYIQDALRSKLTSDSNSKPLAALLQASQMELSLHDGDYARMTELAAKQHSMHAMLKAVGLSIRASYTASLLK